MSDTAIYLRDVRRARSISQSAAASLTTDAPVVVDRAFVAGLESRGMPQTVRKFLAYAHALGADLRVVHELDLLGSAPPHSQAPIDYAVARAECMRAANTGRFSEACAWALAALATERSRQDEAGQAKSLLLLASVMKEAGRWHAAREFAERAVATRALSPVNRARAILLIAAASDELGIPEFAEALVSTIDEETLRASSDVEMLVLTTIGVSRAHRGLHALALEAFERAEAAVGDRTPPEVRVRLIAQRALALAELGRGPEALDLIDQAEAASNALGVEAKANVLVLLGRACAAYDRRDRAEFLLHRATEVAERHDLRGSLLEAQIALARLALRRGDGATFRRMTALAQKAVRSGQHRRGLVAEVAELAALLEESRRR